MCIVQAVGSTENRVFSFYSIFIAVERTFGRAEFKMEMFFFSASLTEIRVHYAFFYFCQKISIKATNHPSFYHPELINVDTGYILSNIFVYLPLQILAGMYIIKMKLKSRHAGERGLFIN